MDLDSDVVTDTCREVPHLEDFLIAECVLEDDKQWRTGGPDEQVSANCIPRAGQAPLEKLEHARPPPSIIPQPSVPRVQPLHEKSSTLRPEKANPCTVSLPTCITFGCATDVTEHFLGRDVSLETCFMALSLSQVMESRVRGHASLPALTQEQKMMFTPDEDGDTQLTIAVSQGNEKATLYIISKAPNYAYLDIRNNERRTAIHIAVVNSMYRCVAELLIKGASLHFEDFEGHNAFHIAAFQGDLKMLDILRQYGTKTGKKTSPSSISKLINTKNFEGYTCFHLAVYSGIAQLIHRITDLGADVNAKDGKSGRTALHHAVEGGNIQLVEYLLKVIKVDVNATTFSRHTPLGLALGRNFGNIAVLLSNYGGFDCESDDDCDMDLAS